MTVRNSYLRRRLWWVRHWFWLADDMNNAFGEFDNTIMDVFEMRTRFKLGLLPRSGDIETEPSQGQTILDSFSLESTQKRMRPETEKQRRKRLRPRKKLRKKRRRRHAVIQKKESFKRLSDIARDRQVLDDNLSFILGESAS